jgi:hypothetical protein
VSTRRRVWGVIKSESQASETTEGYFKNYAPSHSLCSAICKRRFQTTLKIVLSSKGVESIGVPPLRCNDPTFIPDALKMVPDALKMIPDDLKMIPDALKVISDGLPSSS